MVKFYLGTDTVAFTRYASEMEDRKDIPWFINCRRNLKRKKPIIGEYIMDSSGFTEITKFGKYTISEDDYINCIKRLKPQLAFCQDWMCEDVALNKTGLSIKDHQLLTLKSYLSLSQRSDRIMPVLQGVTKDDYINHLKMHDNVVNTDGLLFGLGSVCKRRDYKEIEHIVHELDKYKPNIKLHGFGVKYTAFSSKLLVDTLYSADSMAWSFNGRHHTLACEDCKRQTNCKHCIRFAFHWYDRITNEIKKTENGNEF